MWRLILVFKNGDEIVVNTNTIRIRNGKLITRLNQRKIAIPLETIDVLEYKIDL